MSIISEEIMKITDQRETQKKKTKAEKNMGGQKLYLKGES